MSEVMRILYDYILDTAFAAYLCSDAFRMQETEAEQLGKTLRRSLSGELQPLLEQYAEALDRQHHLELEAMFQAAFALSRALG